MPCYHPSPGLHICTPTVAEKEEGPTCKVFPRLRGDVVKTTCCRKTTLARETWCRINYYEWYEPDIYFYCKKNLGHCGIGWRE